MKHILRILLGALVMSCGVGIVIACADAALRAPLWWPAFFLWTFVFFGLILVLAGLAIAKGEKIKDMLHIIHISLP